MSTINGFGTVPGLPLPDEGTTGAPAPQTTAPTQPTTQPSPSQVVSPPPLFSLQLGGPGTALLLGLSRPRGNFGDTEAVFSQIAAALKTVQAEANDNEDFLRSSERLTQTARAGTVLQQMAEINGQMVVQENRIMNLRVRIDTIDEELVPLRAKKAELEAQVPSLQEQLTGLERQISTLTGQIDALATRIQSLTNSINGLTNQINTLNQQIGQLDSEIGQLNTQIGGLDSQISTWNAQIQSLRVQLAATTDPAQRAALQGQINTLQSSVSTATASLNALVTERTGLVQERAGLVAERDQRVSERSGLEASRSTLTAERDGKIAERSEKEAQRQTVFNQLVAAETELNQVNEQIEGLEAEKAAAEEAILASQRVIAGLARQLTDIARGAFIVAQAMLSLLRGDGMRDSFDTRTYTDDFEATLAQILAEVSRVVEDKADREFTQENAQVGLGDWRFEQGVGIAARFGAMQPAQTMAIGFASALASVIGTLRTLLDQADSLPQNPVALAEAGIARMRMTL